MIGLHRCHSPDRTPYENAFSRIQYIRDRLNAKVHFVMLKLISVIARTYTEATTVHLCPSRKYTNAQNLILLISANFDA